MPVTASGIKYDRAGDPGRPSVLLVHAGVADRRMWDPQWPALAAGFDVVRPDLRGFGDSAAAPEGALDHVADLLALLDGLGVDRCHVVGSSFGAGVAVELALTAADRVASLLLAPPGGSLLAAMTPDLRAFVDAESAALDVGDLDAAVEANVDAWVVGADRDRADADPAVAAAVRRMQRRAFEVGEALGEPEEVELDPPALDRLGEVRAPTLVVVGRHDLDTSRDAADRVARGIPGARRVDWPDVAHLPSMEQPARFTDLLLDWLAEHRA
ncbi:alpha/beta fold hydrolase [uncultured Phycicoccus sp.]|uniref:alpha/beta fold hydrolase n=1 Tax=uncultured Phycicoccus sp. TaxID=661422 RepID=UPI002616C828|nr:alpha/beta hydrolase [uncultured Phycicoccus sp.]